jgi:hypothetical protein
MAHSTGLGYSHVQTRADQDEHDDYNEKATEVSYGRPLDAERDVGLYNQSGLTGTAPVAPRRESYEPRMEPAQAAGTAFPLGPGAAEVPSRTMQLAYSDPCECIWRSYPEGANS